MRKPKEYQAREPGDIVQVDTLDVRPLPGVVLKHFTARDVVSRWDVLEVHTRATATTAKAFLDAFCRAYQEPDSTYPSIAPRVGHTVVAKARKYASYDPAKGQEIVVTVSRDGEAVMILVTLRTRE